MDVREKLAFSVCNATQKTNYKCDFKCEKKGKCAYCLVMAEQMIAHGVTVQECARPMEEWGEDYGDVLWWKFPIEEPPYVGSPLDEKWPAYHTHWTPIVMPQPPKGE